MSSGSWVIRKNVCKGGKNPSSQKILYTSELMNFAMKFWHDNFEVSIYIMWKFQLRIFQQIWEISRQRVSWSGRVVPVHHGYEFYT